jgi:hypothetical protein
MLGGLRAAQAQQHVRLERDLGPLRALVTGLHQASTEATQRVPRPGVCLASSGMRRMGKAMERSTGACAVVLSARWETSRRLLGKERLEDLMHNLGHGRPVAIGLPADGLEPALFDIKVTRSVLRLASGDGWRAARRSRHQSSILACHEGA